MTPMPSHKPCEEEARVEVLMMEVKRSNLTRDEAYAVLSNGGCVRSSDSTSGFYMFRDGRQIRGRFDGDETVYALGCANWPRTIGEETDLFDELA